MICIPLDNGHNHIPPSTTVLHHILEKTQITQRLKVIIQASAHSLDILLGRIMYKNLKIQPFFSIILMKRTTKRSQTFYDGDEKRDVCKGICHIPVAKPFSNDLRKVCIISFVQCSAFSDFL